MVINNCSSFSAFKMLAAKKNLMQVLDFFFKIERHLN